MKLLVDANLSPRVAASLADHGFEATHVGDIGLLAASDDEILDWASEHDHVVVTADSDFAMLVAIRRADMPSIVHLRDVADQPPDAHTALLIANLGPIEDALAAGAIASLSPTQLRIRDLPID